MSVYLCINNGTESKRYTCKTTASKPYLRVKDAYLPLTTETGTGLKIKANGNTYRPLETYTTTTAQTVWVSNLQSRRTISTYLTRKITYGLGYFSSSGSTNGNYSHSNSVSNSREETHELSYEVRYDSETIDGVIAAQNFQSVYTDYNSTYDTKTSRSVLYTGGQTSLSTRVFQTRFYTTFAGNTHSYVNSFHYTSYSVRRNTAYKTSVTANSMHKSAGAMACIMGDIFIGLQSKASEGVSATTAINFNLVGLNNSTFTKSTRTITETMSTELTFSGTSSLYYMERTTADLGHTFSYTRETTTVVGG